MKDKWGILYFAYFKIYLEDSSYITFSNSKEYTNEYYAKVDSESMYFQQYIRDSSKNIKLILWPKDTFNLGSNLIFKKGYWHGLNIVTHVDNHVIEGYDFLTHKDNHRINEFYIRHYDVLKKFIERFKVVFADEITKAELYKAKYKKGFVYDIPEYQEVTAQDIQSFLDSIGYNDNIKTFDAKSGNFIIENKVIQFTQQQLKCLELLSKGYLQKEIGTLLSLNPNTVQTHLNRIKKKTGIFNKHSLIKLYNNIF